MQDKNLYEAPKSNLESKALKDVNKYNLWKRFYITFLWGFPVFMFFVIAGTSKDAWFNGAVGSVLFAIGSGLVAMLIPAQKKRIFVSIGVLLGITTAIAFGIYLGSE